LVRANIDVPIATSGKTALAFYPDRILVMKSDAITAVAYQDLQIDAGQTRSVESRYCPQDATILDHTWQYVDESGGPDKRVKHNPEIPVCLYSHLRFTAPGLDVRWMASTENGFESFATALLRLSHSLQDQGSTAAPAGA